MYKIVAVLKLTEYVGNINIAMHVVGRTQRYIIDSPKRIYVDNKDIFFRDFGYWPRNLEFHIIALRNRFLFRVQIFHKCERHFWLTTPSYCKLIYLPKYDKGIELFWENYEWDISIYMNDYIVSYTKLWI